MRTFVLFALALLAAPAAAQDAVPDEAAAAQDPAPEEAAALEDARRLEGLAEEIGRAAEAEPAPDTGDAVTDPPLADAVSPPEEASDLIVAEGLESLAPRGPTRISPASEAVIRGHMTRRNADIAPLVARKNELQRAFDGLLTPATYDEAALATTMAEMRAVEGEIVEKIGLSMLALLKALPEGDRALFFRTLTRAEPAPSARPAPRPAVPAPEPGEGR